MRKKRIGWVAAYALSLTAFTMYLLLDTFAIARVYARADAGAEEIKIAETVEEYALSGEAEQGENGATTGKAIWTDSGYSDGNIQIELSQLRVSDTTVYVAEVTLASPEYLKTALAQNAYGRNVTAATSAIAAQAGAILAINGDYYGAQESGYVIRGGVLYRATAKRGAQDLVIYDDGRFEIIEEAEVTAQQLMDRGAWNVLSFGPALVEDGTISVSPGDEVGRAKADNPRTAIGVIDELHYLLVVSSGRTGESEGLSLYELAQVMQSLGAQTAYNLDGGGSSTMVFAGQVVNNPTTSGRSISERSVSDIVYVGY